jgi:hypothetical protein
LSSGSLAIILTLCEKREEREERERERERKKEFMSIINLDPVTAWLSRINLDSVRIRGRKRRERERKRD